MPAGGRANWARARRTAQRTFGVALGFLFDLALRSVLWGAKPRMLPGFNTNVRHGGVLFHVQTEDSGRAHPHVITHLYHGGTILASEKRSYAEQLEALDLSRRVREVMDAQHHAMLGRLRGGELDEQIEQRLGSDVFTKGGAKSKSKSGSGHTQRANADSEPEPTIPPEVARPLAGLTTPILPVSPAVTAPPAAASPGAERPLDELILDYLVEAARKRKRRTE